MGTVGGFLAVLGVIVLPITSGDTAFRSTRLILAEAMKMDQKKASKRLMIAIPLFVIGYIISTQKFGTIWRYFGWSNQTLATLVLWSGAIYLAQKQKLHWICTVPAVFMTAVVSTFICNAKFGFNMALNTSIWIGVATAIICFCVFLFKFRKNKSTVSNES